VARIKTDTVRGFNFLAFHPRSRVGPAILAAAAWRRLPAPPGGRSAWHRVV